MTEKTIFSRIIDREIPSDIVFEDEHCIVIRDIVPQAPVHLLVIPKKCIPSTNDIGEDDGEILAHLFQVIRKMAVEQGVAETGYRVVLNCGKDATQTVHHLHFHVLGGRVMEWPPG